MRGATIFGAALAAASSVSANFMVLSAADIDWPWSVTDWKVECVARRTCNYSFEVSGEGSDSETPKRPSFTASCANKDVASYEQSLCSITDGTDIGMDITSKLVQLNTTGASHIQVSLQHTDLDTPTTYWNYTGVGTAKSTSFEMQPTVIFGAA